MTFRNTRLIRKATVNMAIQTAFEDIGISFFNVNSKLQRNYGYSTFNIIENPQHLKKVIRDLHSDKYEQIIDAIKKNLSEDSNNISIECFLESLSK